MSSPTAKCVILVPAFKPPVPKCEEGLRELEKRGYPVRRVRGFSAIDQGRNEMASDALFDGFAETTWIDADMDFSAEAVERLRSHDLPIVGGLYPRTDGRSLASELLEPDKEVTLGKSGGLIELKYAAAGFLYVRRDAYETIRDKLKLPLCNTRFGRGIWPFFRPVAVEEAGSVGDRNGHRYLTEDFAFSHRARQAGLRIMADTTIRLGRVGTYAFGWEDAGQDRKRNDSAKLRLK